MNVLALHEHFKGCETKHRNIKKIKTASAAGAVIGIAAAVSGIYAAAKKSSPIRAFKNFSYNENYYIHRNNNNSCSFENN